MHPKDIRFRAATLASQGCHAMLPWHTMLHPTDTCCRVPIVGLPDVPPQLPICCVLQNQPKARYSILPFYRYPHPRGIVEHTPTGARKGGHRVLLQNTSSRSSDIRLLWPTGASLGGRTVLLLL